jgi:hypothetical protein
MLKFVRSGKLECSKSGLFSWRTHASVAELRTVKVAWLKSLLIHLCSIINHLRELGYEQELEWMQRRGSSFGVDRDFEELKNVNASQDLTPRSSLPTTLLACLSCLADSE